jgi:hypothetical protein
MNKRTFLHIAAVQLSPPLGDLGHPCLDFGDIRLRAIRLFKGFPRFEKDNALQGDNQSGEAETESVSPHP